jgi:hypothetical protein
MSQISLTVQTYLLAATIPKSHIFVYQTLKEQIKAVSMACSTKVATPTPVCHTDSNIDSVGEIGLSLFINCIN